MDAQDARSSPSGRGLGSILQEPREALYPRMSPAPSGRKYVEAEDTRQLVLSEEPFQGLQNGDVVYFLSEKNDPFATTKIQSERESIFAFAPCEDGSVDAGHQSCYLEVVREGKWVGFRSMYAQNKFLQARRKGVNKLCFFNTNFGTWEQFELFPQDTDVSVSWNRLKLCFQSRRLAQFRMQVTVCRVGHFSGTKAIFDPKGILLGAKEGQRQALTRVSDVMVKEWVKFVERELKERESTEEKIELMRKDTKLLHQWTTNRLVELKDHAREDIGILQETLDKSRAYAKFKKDQLKDTEEELTSHRIVISDAVKKRREVKNKTSCFIAWQKYTAQSALEHYAESQMYRLRSKILLNFVVGLWHRYTRDTLESKLKVASFREKQQMKQLKLVLREWMLRKEYRYEKSQRLARYIQRIEFVKLNMIMHSWMKLVAFRKRIEVGLRIHQNMSGLHSSLRLRAVFSNWRHFSSRRSLLNHILGTFLVKNERKKLRDTFNGFRSYLIEQKRVQRSLSLHSIKWQRHLWTKAFQSWVLVSSNSSQIESQKVDYFIMKRLQSTPFFHWKHMVKDNRWNELRAQNLRKQHQSNLKRKLLGFWNYSIKEKKDFRLKSSLIAKSHAEKRIRSHFHFWQMYCSKQRWSSRRTQLILQKRYRLLLEATFASWRWYGENIRTNVLAFTQKRIWSEIKHHFSKWKGLPTRSKERELREGLQYKIIYLLQHRKLNRLCRVWREVAFEKKNAKRRCQMMRERTERRTLWQAFLNWKILWEETISACEIARTNFLFKTMQTYFAFWLEYASHQNDWRCRVERSNSKLDVFRLSSSLEHWKKFCHFSDMQKDTAEQLWERKQYLWKRDLFHGWIDIIIERRQYVELVEKLVRRFSRNLLARLFCEWSEGTKLLVHYRKSLDKFKRRSNAKMTYAVVSEWMHTVREKRSLRRSEALLRNRLRRMRMFYTFEEWHAHVRQRIKQNQKVHTMRNRIEGRKKRALFHGFHTYVWQKRTMLLKLERFRALIASKRLKKVFFSWVNQMVHGRRLHIVCSRLLDRYAFISKSKAFDQWVSRIHEKQEALSNIRRCVKRKQVSLNFFTSWYWDALDDDVQFTLTNILHSAAPPSSTFVEGRGGAYKPLFGSGGSGSKIAQKLPIKPPKYSKESLADDSSPDSFVGREYEPLFEHESPNLLTGTTTPAQQKYEVDLSVNPLASKNLLPNLDLESIDRNSLSREEDSLIFVREDSSLFQERSFHETPPGLNRSNTGGLAELLQSESEIFSPLNSQATSRANTPLASPMSARLASARSSPMASPYKGRMERIDNYMKNEYKEP